MLDGAFLFFSGDFFFFSFSFCFGFSSASDPSSLSEEDGLLSNLAGERNDKWKKLSVGISVKRSGYLHRLCYSQIQKT